MNDEEICGHKIKMLAEPCLHCELKKAYDRIVELERRETREYDCCMVGLVAEMSGSHCPHDAPCQRCQLERAEEALTRERDRLITRLLYLVPMASMELTTEYLREELAKETPHEE